MSDTIAEIQRRFMRQAQLRIEPEMAQYVMRHALPAGDLSTSPPAETLVVMGADARTGMPIRRSVNVREILNP